MLERFALACLTAALACFGLAFVVAPGSSAPPHEPVMIRPATAEEEMRWQLEHARDMRHAGVDETESIR